MIVFGILVLTAIPMGIYSTKHLIGAKRSELPRGEHLVSLVIAFLIFGLAFTSLIFQ